MKLTEKESVQLKTVQLEMFRVIVDICEKLNLRYYLLVGTLIGAVRHKGYIPWDDDIDIGMMREDYEVFLKKAPELLPEHLFLQTVWTDKEYLMCFAKIRNSETTYIEKTVAHRKINHGVFVDIFPLDYYPEEPSEQKKFDFKMKVYEARICAEFALENRSRKTKIIEAILKCIYPSVRRVIEKKEELIQSVQNSKLVANHGGFKEETAPAEWYGEGVTVTFEGLQATAPTEYHKLLTQIYGDYMTPPPEEEREGHHYTVAIDFEKPYTEYMDIK